MKTNLLYPILLAALLATAPRARAEISIEVLYDRLEPYGDWIEVADYGYCWQPREVTADWRPYTVGGWVYTDAGWTWLSDEPFGWATYHYGRWVRLTPRGWVWVPDTQWSPAWVSWRQSDRYVGWAPLPPETRLIVDGALGTWVDAYFETGPTAYCFVETRHFGAPGLADALVASAESVSIIAETRNVTNVRVVNNVVINNGPDFGTVAGAADRPMRMLRLVREDAAPATATGVNLKARVEGGTLKMAAPRVIAQATTKPRKIAQKVVRAEVDRGWNDAGPVAEIRPLREKLRAEEKVPDGLPLAKASAKGLMAGQPTPALPLPPIAEPPPPKASPKLPPAQRHESRPPTPEPLRYREPRPDGTDRVERTPPATLPPDRQPSRLQPEPRG